MKQLIVFLSIAVIGLIATGLHTVHERNKTISGQEEAIKSLHAENQKLREEVCDLKYWPAIEYYVTVDATECGDGSKENPWTLKAAQDHLYTQTNFSHRVFLGMGIYNMEDSGGTMTAGEHASVTHLIK